jgi:NTE family protein
MIAFVLSGGGNRGPLQVGALRALLEDGIEPDFIVGTSAGAINAAFLGAHGFCAETLDQMETMWKGIAPQTIYPGGWWQLMWRLLRRGPSLYSSEGVRATIQASLPMGMETFGDFRLPIYVTAVDLISARLFVFGEDPAAPIVDAMVASASVPVIHPPVALHAMQLVDGGVLANVAASFAMDKGARELYVLNASAASGIGQAATNMLDVAGNTLHTMLAQAILRDLDRAKVDDRLDLHHIHIAVFQSLPFRDFSRTDEMLTAGYETARAYLAAPAPLIAAPAERRTYGVGESLPGAREYYPGYLAR